MSMNILLMSFGMPLLFVLMVGFGFWAVIAGELIKSAIALALVSASLSCVLFLMDMPWAGVFELSVCAGLITVVFISAISLTKPDHLRSPEERAVLRSGRMKNTLILVVVLAAITFTMALLMTNGDIQIPAGSQALGVREVIWDERRFDLVGQIIILLAGILGVVVLFKRVANQAQGAKK